MKKVKRFLTALLCVCLLAGVMAPAASAVTVLTIINLTVDAPAAGKKPATTASVPSTAHSTVKKVEWSGSLDSDGTFKAGESYTVTVTMGIKKGENWKFSPNVTMNVKVNEKAADKVYYINDGELEVVYTFPKLSGGQSSSANQSSSTSKSPAVLTSAEITINAPDIGKTPATTAKVPSDAAYTVKSVEWSGSLSSGKFKENTSYTAYITLGIKSGKNAVFSDETFDAVVNAFYLIDEIRWVSPTEIIVPVEFDKTASAPSSSSSSSSKGTAISIIRLTVDEPGAGKKPAATASLPSTAHSTVQSVKWSGELDTDGTFMYRTKYTVTVTLGIMSGENYYFSDKAINATVNGKDADEVRWYSNDKVEVIYTFPAFGTSSTINQAIITLDGPAVGGKPATTAHVPSTASTYVKSIRWEGALDSNGRFQAGTEYTAYLTLAMKDNGRKFSEKSFDATVNGVLINEVTRVSDTEIIIPVEFERTPGTAPAASNNTVTASGGTATKFTDVAASSPFAAAINWAVEKGITTGKPDGTFAPGENCSNAHILTFLWRGNGSPEPKGTVEMEGFTGSEYYYKAAQWAAEQNMVEGEFNPDTPCTRSMVVTYLWKLAGKPAVSGSAGFPDVASGASYAQAVAWAVQNGITTGKANGTFAPNEVCTRGQIVTFIYRDSNS